MGSPTHRKKLFGGRATAEEVHSKHAFPVNAQCQGCKTRGVITRIIILGPLDEMKKRDPLLDVLAEVDPQKFLKLLVPTKDGPHIKISTTYACKMCTPALERAAAKGPSWVIVDIHRGPGPDKVVVGFGS